MIDHGFWRNRKVFLTGHTGFKGSWLCLWLCHMGAEVTGYALEPPTDPALFTVTGLHEDITSIHGDVRDYERLATALQRSQPEVVFHLAAQPLVLASCDHPVETTAINLMGTVHLLEAIRQIKKNMAVINVTTDKCYRNPETGVAFNEDAPLGGRDPYSASKACAELMSAAYRDSYFSPDSNDDHDIILSTVRAGNVIGGGDWAANRLVPDCIRSLADNRTIHLRNPQAIRPWQHVLAPLHGYLLLAQYMLTEGHSFAGAWNFGPPESECKPVRWVAERIQSLWGSNNTAITCQDIQPRTPESATLILDSTKAHTRLGWRSCWDLDTCLKKTTAWYKQLTAGKVARDLCLAQINDYEKQLHTEPEPQSPVHPPDRPLLERVLGDDREDIWENE